MLSCMVKNSALIGRNAERKWFVSKNYGYVWSMLRFLYNSDMAKFRYEDFEYFFTNCLSSKYNTINKDECYEEEDYEYLENSREKLLEAAKDIFDDELANPLNFELYHRMYVNWAHINAIRSNAESVLQDTYYYNMNLDPDLEEEQLQKLISRLYTKSTTDIDKRYDAVAPINIDRISSVDIYPTEYDILTEEQKRVNIFWTDDMRPVLRTREASKIIGISKKGKSFFASRMALTIANGLDETWINDKMENVLFHSRKTPVLIVDYEMNKEDYGERLAKTAKEMGLEGNFEKPCVFSVLDARNTTEITLDMVLGTIKEWVRNNPKSLVIIDPFSKFFADFARPGGNENDSASTNKVFGVFDKIMSWDCALMYVAHISGKDSNALNAKIKENRDSLGNVTRGSSGHGDYGGTVFAVVGDDDYRRVLFSCRGAGFTHEESTGNFRRADGVFVPCADPNAIEELKKYKDCSPEIADKIAEYLNGKRKSKGSSLLGNIWKAIPETKDISIRSLKNYFVIVEKDGQSIRDAVIKQRQGFTGNLEDNIE